jgi:hypothetical protein
LSAGTAQRREAAAPAAGTLDVRLDARLPEALAVGAGTAVFVCGTCFSAAGPIASLVLVVDGREQPLMAHGMPRLDLLRATGVATSYRAGFWGLAQIGPQHRDAIAVGVRARLGGGRTVVAELGRIAIAPPPRPHE